MRRPSGHTGSDPRPDARAAGPDQGGPKQGSVRELDTILVRELLLCYGQGLKERCEVVSLFVLWATELFAIPLKVCAVQDPACCCCGCKLFGSRREPARFPRSGGTGPRGGAGVEAMLDGVILRCSAEEMERRGWTWPRTGSRRGPLFDASPAGPPTNLNPSSLPHAGVGHINRSTGAQSG